MSEVTFSVFPQAVTGKHGVLLIFRHACITCGLRWWCRGSWCAAPPPCQPGTRSSWPPGRAHRPERWHAGRNGGTTRRLWPPALSADRASPLNNRHIIISTWLAHMQLRISAETTRSFVSWTCFCWPMMFGIHTGFLKTSYIKFKAFPDSILQNLQWIFLKPFLICTE